MHMGPQEKYQLLTLLGVIEMLTLQVSLGIFRPKMPQ